MPIPPRPTILSVGQASISSFVTLVADLTRRTSTSLSLINWARCPDETRLSSRLIPASFNAFSPDSEIPSLANTFI